MCKSAREGTRPPPLDIMCKSAREGTRTPMPEALDPKSSVSTSFTTLAEGESADIHLLNIHFIKLGGILSIMPKYIQKKWNSPEIWGILKVIMLIG